MKKLLIVASFIFFTTSSLLAQLEDYQASAAFGAGVLSGGSGKPNADFGYITATFTRYHQPSWGVGAGVTRSIAMDGSDRVDGFWELPLYYTFRSGASTASSEQFYNDPSLGSFLSVLIPARFDFKVGPTIVYFLGERNAYSRSGSYTNVVGGYELRKRMGLAVDAELQLLYVISQVKLGVGLVGGYLFTDNLSYFGKDNNMFAPNQHAEHTGLVPHIRLRFQLSVAYAFDWGKKPMPSKRLTDRELKYK